MASKKVPQNRALVDFSKVAKDLEKLPASDFIEKSFLSYAYAVITSRAIPDVRDGLKPVQRRILYTMHHLGYTADKKHVKSARIVGDVMGRFHPHGDSAIYDAMVRLAQSFSLRLPLIDGEGNFGTDPSDSAAAPRYTESKLDAMATPLLADLKEKGSVLMVPNYDETEMQPSILPARYPNLLINGASGIAVGMATNLAPHNPTEVMRATRFLLKNPDATIDQIMKYIPGPDFPGGGEIIGLDMVKQAYETGRGIFRMRAKYEIINVGGGKQFINFTELPYGVSVESVVAKIKAHRAAFNALEEAKNKKTTKKAPGSNPPPSGFRTIASEKDLTDRLNGSLLQIELKKSINPQAVIQELYKYTPLEESFGVNAVVIRDGEPVLLNLKEILESFLAFRLETVIKRTQVRLERRGKRLNQLEGLLKIMLDIDKAISIIRKSDTVDIAKASLIKSFKIDEEQAAYVLELQLRRLTRMDEHALKNEKAELEEEVKALNKILDEKEELIRVVDEELAETAKIIASPRRSTIIEGTLKEFTEEVKEIMNTTSLEVADAPCFIRVHASGKISRSATNAPLTKRGKIDPIVSSIETTTRGHFVLVLQNGTGHRVESIVLNEDAKISAKGLGLSHNESDRIVAVAPNTTPDGHTGLALGTKLGTVKISVTDFPKTLSEFPVISLADGDEVIGGGWVKDASQTHFAFVSQDASLLRFEASKVRPQGSKGGGMAGIKLADGKVAVNFSVIDLAKLEEYSFVTYTGTTIKVSEFNLMPVKGRATSGQRAHAFRKGETPEILFAAIAPNLIVIDDDGNEIGLPAHAKRDATGIPTPERPVLAGTLSM